MDTRKKTKSPKPDRVNPGNQPPPQNQKKKREKRTSTNKAPLGKGRSEDVSQILTQRRGTPLGQLMGDRHASREIRLKIVDYFDIKKTGDKKGAYQYSFGTANNLFIDPSNTPPDGSSINNFIRVISATFYALPRLTTGSGTISSDASGVIVGFSVPALLPEEVISGEPAEPTPVAVCQQSTFLEPTSVYRWVKVGQFRQKVFDTTLVQPTFVQDFGAMILGTLAVLDPDSGAYLDGVGIQCRVDIQATYAVPTVITFKGAVNPQLTTNQLNPWTNRLELDPDATIEQIGFLNIQGSKDVS